MFLFVFKMLPHGFCVHILLTVSTCLEQQLNLGSHPPLVYLLLLILIATGVQGPSTTQICSQTNKMSPNPSDTSSVKSPLIILLAYIHGALNDVLMR